MKRFIIIFLLLSGTVYADIFTSHLKPNADGTLDIGTTDLKWRNVYADLFSDGAYDSLKWNDAYNLRVNTWTLPLSVSNRVVSMTQSGAAASGYLTSTDWNTFDNKYDSGDSPSFVRGTFTEPILSPFVITSTVVNINLNADLWDGYQFSDYIDQAVKTTSSPTFAGLTLSGLTTTRLLYNVNDVITDSANMTYDGAVILLNDVGFRESFPDYPTIVFPNDVVGAIMGGAGDSISPTGSYIYFSDSTVHSNMELGFGDGAQAVTTGTFTISKIENSAATLWLKLSSVGLGVGGIVTPTARLHLIGGTTTVAPLRFTIGSLLSSVAITNLGSFEFDGSYFYGLTYASSGTPYTVTRNKFTQDTGLTAGRIPYVSAAGTLKNVLTDSANLTFDGSTFKTLNIQPITDNTYYIGKNDDDTPFAYKGIIFKDQAGTGKYYRLEIYNDALRIVDLTD